MHCSAAENRAAKFEMYEMQYVGYGYSTTHVCLRIPHFFWLERLVRSAANPRGQPGGGK